MKRLIGIILSISILLSSFCGMNFSVFAESNSNIIYIYDKYGLNNIRNNLSASYILKNNIVFSEEDFAETGDFYNSGNGWKPLGSSSTPFKGVFDGNGFSVSGIKSVATSDNSGLFGYSTGTVKNLSIYDSSFSSAYSYSAAVVGYNEGYISNCHNFADVSGKYSVGGIAGINWKYSVTDCTNSGTIIGTNVTGGITGVSCGTTIRYCENYGEVKSNHYCGGIVGDAFKHTTIHTVNFCKNYGIISGVYDVGGIVGDLYKNVSVNNCVNSGIIQNSDYSTSCGGIAGGISYNSRISNCYNLGSIGSNKIPSCSGGIVGSHSIGNFFIENCYNFGAVNSNNSTAGGIIGKTDDGNINNCYSIGEISGYRAGGIVGNSLGLSSEEIKNCYYTNAAKGSGTTNYVNSSVASCTLEEMKEQSTFLGFDFESVWAISPAINNGLPYLRSNPFDTSAINLDDAEIKLYSELPTFSIGKGRAVGAAVQLEYNGVVLSADMLKGGFDFSFSVSDSSVLQISNISEKSDGVYFSINGVEEGLAKLTITENVTGKVYSATVEVTSGIITYNAEALPSYYNRNNEYNGYVSGIYIDEFVSSDNGDNTMSVSFNAYNTVNISGVVTIYDKNGYINDIQKIDRFEDTNITSVKDALASSLLILKDIALNDLFTYKSEVVSQKTEFSLTVPKGGKVEITNDPSYSDACALINYTEFLVEAVVYASEAFKDEESLEILPEKISDNFLKKYLHYLLEGDTVYSKFENLAQKFSEQIAENTAEKVLSDSVTSGLSTVVENGLQIYQSVGIDFSEILLDTSKDFGLDVAEDALIKALGGFGTVLKGMFYFAKAANLLTFYITINKEHSNQALEIYFNDENGCLCDNGVTIKAVENDMLTKNNFVMRSVVISNDIDLENTAKDSLNTVSNTQKYTVRNIYLERDGEISQPGQSVQVSMPVPQNYNPAKSKLYWVDDNGNLTEMPVSYENGNFVFITDHFSYYAVVETVGLKVDELFVNLSDTLSLNIQTNKELFETEGYTNPRITIEKQSFKTDINKYISSDKSYTFILNDIDIEEINDNFSVSLFAEYGSAEYSSELISVKLYDICRSQCDTNGDGNTDVLDIVRIKKKLAQINNITANDIFIDGCFDTKDLLYIKKFLIMF